MKHFFKAALVSCIGVSLLSIPVKASWKGSLAEEVGTRAIPYFSRSLSRGFIPTSRSSFLLGPHAPYTSTRRQYSTNHEGPFFDPKNDIAFKKLFATEPHKPLLIDVLNSLLHRKKGHLIKEVELLPTENVPKIATAKKSILDVKCTDERNIQYIVEMQNRKVPNFIKRSQYYVSHTYSSQLSGATDYLQLRPVILLTIANHDLFPDKEGHISFHRTLDTQTQENDLEDLSYVFVELPKFTKEEKDLGTHEDHWLYLLKHADRMKEMPKSIPKELQEAYKTLEEHGWSAAEKEAYDKANMALMDEFDALRDANEKGIEKGIEKGRKGVALKLLLTKMMSDEQIQEVAGLSPEELAELKIQIKKY